MNIQIVSKELEKLAMLKFFPADQGARLGILEIVCAMAKTEEQVTWLVKRMTTMYNEWPGPKELRAMFCSKFRPADGVECYSAVFEDGIPSELEAGSTAGLLASRSQRLIGGEVAMFPESQAVIDELVRQMPKMPEPIYPANDRFSKLLGLTTTAPQDRPEAPAKGSTPQIITEADFARVIAERNAARP
jgi:hypothetical protein